MQLRAKEWNGRLYYQLRLSSGDHADIVEWERARVLSKVVPCMKPVHKGFTYTHDGSYRYVPEDRIFTPPDPEHWEEMAVKLFAIHVPEVITLPHGCFVHSGIRLEDLKPEWNRNDIDIIGTVEVYDCIKKDDLRQFSGGRRYFVPPDHPDYMNACIHAAKYHYWRAEKEDIGTKRHSFNSRAWNRVHKAFEKGTLMGWCERLNEENKSSQKWNKELRRKSRKRTKTGQFCTATAGQ